jgi:hypothetical protein
LSERQIQSWDDAEDGLGIIWSTFSKSCTSVGKPTAIPKNSRHACVGQGQDPLSRCPVGILNVGGGQVPLSCTSVGIPTAIPEDQRQALMGQRLVPLLRCNPCWTALDYPARSHSLNVNLGALGAAWSVETGIHGQLDLEYSVGQLEL